MKACHSIVFLILATILPTLKERQFIGASDAHSDFGARRGPKWDDPRVASECSVRFQPYVQVQCVACNILRRVLH
jgi:hypothetical protein